MPIDKFPPRYTPYTTNNTNEITIDIKTLNQFINHAGKQLRVW